MNNKNAYYHAFRIGFNWWYITIPLMFVLCILFATLFYRIVIRKRDGSLDVRQGYKMILQLPAAILCTVITAVMITKESYNGLVQLLDNSLTKNDSPAWSIFIAPAIIGFITAVAFCLYFWGAFSLGRAAKFLLNRKKIEAWESHRKVEFLSDQALTELERRRHRER